MKIIDRYYLKIYNQTNKISKKLFGVKVPGALHLRFELKKELEKITKKPVNEITDEDIWKNKIGYKMAKYRTLCKVLEILESACTLKTFTIKGYEDEC